ncbi:curli assembly protein CsgF [Pseudomonas matsuisoli]|uniref:Curli production assembly/transport component CsgF n=1 Tax=Pseudomonas matsuisoli TaxID=1515666 RepID=A0A917UX99_9PSED|nr:curli assembly protein CsgF [Pseudomonas matsuisoli]GGJ94153.1 curli production assembly protein CsgF [Pseudomonas matsuisoli]
MKLDRKGLALLASFVLLPVNGHATELVYTPVNPSFGGNPLNGTYLLNNATLQDRNKDPDARTSSYNSQSALERFTGQLESRLLSQILNNIEDGNAGSLTTDQFLINIIDDSGNLTVQITDRITGEMSEIIVNGFDAP